MFADHREGQVRPIRVWPTLSSTMDDCNADTALVVKKKRIVSMADCFVEAFSFSSNGVEPMEGREKEEEEDCRKCEVNFTTIFVSDR